MFTTKNENIKKMQYLHIYYMKLMKSSKFNKNLVKNDPGFSVIQTEFLSHLIRDKNHKKGHQMSK